MQNNIIISEILLFFIYYIVMGVGALSIYKMFRKANNCYKIMNLFVFLCWPLLVAYYFLKCIFYWIPKYIIYAIVTK